MARACTDHIFSLFTPEALYERLIPERHRVIFYVGHLEAFDWNQICRWSLGYSSFHRTFDSLFEAGIDPEVGSSQKDTPADWPSPEEVQEYNTQVREKVDQALEEAPDPIVQMSIEHRWMHAETTAYILHHVSSARNTIDGGSSSARNFSFTVQKTKGSYEITGRMFKKVSSKAAGYLARGAYDST